MRVVASTAIKLHAAACAGGAVVRLRLGAAGRRAYAAAEADPPGATRTSAGGDHRPDAEAGAGPAELAFELLDVHTDTVHSSTASHTAAATAPAASGSWFPPHCSAQPSLRSSLVAWRIGRLRAMLLAAVLFSIGALGAGLVDTPGSLVVFRVIGGIGVAWPQ